jgi:DNA replication protein DnaC
MKNENSFEESLIAMERRSKEREENLQRFIVTQPPEINCKKHPFIIKRITLESTRLATGKNGGNPTAGYEPCPACVEEHAEIKLRERLREQGVPENLLHASIENWKPEVTDTNHLEQVRAFIAKKRGFLTLIGDVGTGKSHLGVGVMRHFHNAFFIKQNSLLRMLRETYRNRSAVDPVIECQNAGLLVLDEVGLSSGGRDELPLLNEVLDFRHCERKPTILTSNLSWESLTDALGQRLSDRLKESTFRVLVFHGDSKRSLAREKYFSE